MSRILGLAFASWLLSGCAAVGHVPANDPLEKTRQAHGLIFDGRLQMAEILLQEAEAMLAHEPNTETEAEVNFAFGSLYGSEAYHSQSALFEDKGTYDGTYARSIAYYEKAIELFGSIDNDLGVAKSMYGLGESQMLRGEKAACCDTWRSALAIYNSGKASGRITTEPEIYGSKYKTAGEFIMSYICANCLGLENVPVDECFARFDQ